MVLGRFCSSGRTLTRHDIRERPKDEGKRLLYLCLTVWRDIQRFCLDFGILLAEGHGLVQDGVGSIPT